MKLFLVWLLMGICAGLTGCTFKAGYNPAYLPTQAAKLDVPGKALVVVSVEEEKRVFSGSPTSFTGGGTTLTLPLGELTKQIALKVFGAAFVDGADFNNDSVEISRYRVVVRPKVKALSYAYNQLKNGGFAVTPQADIELEVELQKGDGRVMETRVYKSGLVDGETYVLSGKPAEKVNQLIHMTLFKLMTDAAVELKTSLGR